MKTLKKIISEMDAGYAAKVLAIRHSGKPTPDIYTETRKAFLIHMKERCETVATVGFWFPEDLAEL